MTSAPTFAWRSLGLVVLGGALGAGARAGLMWPGVLHSDFAFAVTAAINIVGALTLGVVVGVLASRHPAARAFFGTGLLGGFTTFSLFAAQTANNASGGGVGIGGGVLAFAIMAAGVLAAGAGLRIGRGIAHRRGTGDAPEEAE